MLDELRHRKHTELAPGTPYVKMLLIFTKLFAEPSQVFSVRQGGGLRGERAGRVGYLKWTLHSAFLCKRRQKLGMGHALLAQDVAI